LSTHADTPWLCTNATVASVGPNVAWSSSRVASALDGGGGGVGPPGGGAGVPTGGGGAGVDTGGGDVEVAGAGLEPPLLPPHAASSDATSAAAVIDARRGDGARVGLGRDVA